MSRSEILSVVASTASLTLAILAIWLSIVFFRMSSLLSESTKEASKEIGASVERLEKLFDKLYSDTFSMMKDTYSDMRKHIWPEEPIEGDKLAEEVERKADDKVNLLKESIDSDLSAVLRQQEMQESQITEIRQEMSELIERAITSSRQVESEAREETLREHILREIRVLRLGEHPVTAKDIYKSTEIGVKRLIHELHRMSEEDVISMSDTHVEPETIIKLNRP